MRRRDAPKTTSADYNAIERSGIMTNTRILARHCLVERIADIAADVVEREGGSERDGCAHGACSHVHENLAGERITR